MFLDYQNVLLEYSSTILIIGISIALCLKYHRRFHTIILKHENIATKIVSDTTSCIKVLNELKQFNPYILGLDCEWVQKHKISLLQIGHPKLIVLIQLHKLNHIPTELIGLMTDNKVLKTGVGIYGDVSKLQNDYSIHVNGCIDINDILPSISNFDRLLNEYYNNTPHQYKQQMFGLNQLSQILLKHSMYYKDKKIARSDWERNTLTQKQIHYAADDAIIGYRLFKTCMELQHINHNIEDYLSFCVGNIDIKRSSKKRKVKSLKQPNTCSSQTNRKKDKRRSLYQQRHKTNFFDNCRLLKPDGSLLFYCSTKSMQWYLKKRLAQVIDDTTVQLLFEPKIKNERSLGHYKTTQENQCFVCGRSGALCQFEVVPKQYRNCMDLKYRTKGWTLHDFIPLCILCHPGALKIQSILIESLYRKYKDTVPYYKIRKGDEEYKRLCNASRAAKALQRKNINIPIGRKIELLEVLCQYFDLEYEVIYTGNGENKDVDTFDEMISIQNEKQLDTTQIMYKCIEKLELEVQCRSNKSQWKAHAKAIMEIFKENQPTFIEMWRKHFKDNMKPRHLPHTWSVSTSNLLDQTDVTVSEKTLI